MGYRPAIRRPRPGKRTCLAETRAQLLAEDPRCYWCGRDLTPETATVDHYVARSRGGRDHRRNLVISCAGCNALKADMTPEEFCKLLDGDRARKGEPC